MCKSMCAGAIRVSLMLLAGMAAACILAGPALAAGGGDDGAIYVPGELLVQMKPGLSHADIAAVATLAGAAVVKNISVEDWYQIRALDPATTTVEDMQVALAGDSRIIRFEPNYYNKLYAIPNDPYYNGQWGLGSIRIEQAWDTQQGSAAVRVAVTDSAFDLSHPDLAGRWLPGYDVADDDDEVTPPTDCDKLAAWAHHGTFVTGIIAANANNSQGIAGVCWSGVRIIPIKLAEDESETGGFPTSNGILGLDEALKRGAHVVNMSWGSAFPSAALEAKLQQLANAGVILVAAAGNDAGAVGYPAAYDTCIAVSAIGRSEFMSSYSNFGPEIDIAAPGGDFDVITDVPADTGEIWSTTIDCGEGTTPVSGYSVGSGTSYAAPYVAGAAALLLSSGMPASNVRAALQGSARAAGTGLPNDEYGYGILDCSAAIDFSPVNLSIDRPRHGDVLTTLKPFIRISATGSGGGGVQVKVDGENAVDGGTPVDSRVQNFEYNAVTGSLTFTWAFDREGSHRISATITSESDPRRSQTKSVTFTIKAMQLQPGMYLFSSPFAADGIDPGPVLGTSFYRLARAVTSVGSNGVPFISYAYYNFPGLVNDIEASMQPQTVYAGEVNGSDDTLPRGVGYWLDLKAPTSVLSDSFTDDRHSYEIDLLSGWNQIGNPYPFPVAWANVLVTYLGETLPVAKAAERGWISPSLYRYENRAYRSESAPAGTLQPWAGYWVKVKVPRTGAVLSIDDPRGIVTLTFVPLQSGTATGSTSTFSVAAEPQMMTFSTPRGWRDRMRRRADRMSSLDFQMSFSVAQGGDSAQGPTLGVARTAQDGYDIADVESPPPPAAKVWAAISNRDWGADSGYFAVDLRSPSRQAHVWTVNVMTYSPGAVELQWRNTARLQSVYNMEIVDLATGQTLDVTRATHHFEAPAGASVRQFRITAQWRSR